jgi:hypothetical protein
VATTVTITIAVGNFVVTVASDKDPYPDLLSELTTRCRQLFLETQSALPPDEGEE